MVRGCDIRWMSEVELTTQPRLVIKSGNRDDLRNARFTARDIANETLRLKKHGYSRTAIQREVDRDDFHRNNKCAVVGKALSAWTSYEELLKWWKHQEEKPGKKPSKPSHEKKGAYPLVMAHEEGYRIYIRNDGRIGFRITTEPYTYVKGFLRGRKRDLDLLREALESDAFAVCQAELLYREGVYYLHIPVKTTPEIADLEDAETIVGVDINERNIAMTALDRETRDTLGTLVVDYGRVKAERTRHHDIQRRCQEHDKHSVAANFGDGLERYTDWILHRISRTVNQFAKEFSDPMIVFEDMSGIRKSIKYGTYMNRRLHKLPFNKFETFVSYKAAWNGIPMLSSVPSAYNSKTCSLCGERSYRNGGRFRCTNDECSVTQDHADRNASVNIVVRALATLDGKSGDELEHARLDNYRPHKTHPQVRVVRLAGSGRPLGDVNRPTPSHEIASLGVFG